jgi:hypothetical protein
MPLAIETLIPIASAILSGASFMSFAQAAVAAITPTMPVVCQPPTFEARKFARTMRAATSQATMKAVTQSAGVAPNVSATGRIAGITGETD